MNSIPKARHISIITVELHEHLLCLRVADTHGWISSCSPLVIAQRLRQVGPIHPMLCAAVRLLREELQLLQEPGSYVGEVVKVWQS